MSLNANPPDRVGRYEITGELGKGAMGVVYKALDPTIVRTVALKTMRVDIHGADSEEMLKRFRNEARAAGVLNHPNIVTIYDAGEEQGLFYIAMEVMEGRTLQAALVERRVLAVEEIIAISKQVCVGLDYAHSQGVIHRDIKPANIMLTTDGPAKIMDFGIAKAGGGLTSIGQVLGTPNYMSPEQVKGRKLDGRSDLFSYAVILYEMLTGVRPFGGDNVTTIIYKIVNEEPVPPDELDGSIHPGLSGVVMQALRKAPGDRFQSGAELAAALENYDTWKPTSAAAQPLTAAAAAAHASGELVAVASVPVASAAAAPKLAGAPVRRTPRSQLSIATIAAALALIAVLSGYGFYRHRRTLQERADAQARATERAAQARAALPAPSAAQPASPPAVSDAESGEPEVVVKLKPPKQTKKAVAPKPATAEKAGPPKPAEIPPATTAPAPVETADATPAKEAVSPPVPAGALTGTLVIASTPPGAQVEIDGRSNDSWVTPFEVTQLSEGTHRITFELAGYMPESRGVDVIAGQSKSIQAELAPALGTLNVTTTPPGAAILLDGKTTGAVTPAHMQVPSGEHEVVLRKEGFRESAKKFRLAVGATFNFAPELVSESVPERESVLRKIFKRRIPAGKGAVEVRSEPEDAQVLVNGSAQAKRRFFLDPGSYQITLQRAGYKPLVKAITVQKGKTIEVAEKLEKQ